MVDEMLLAHIFAIATKWGKIKNIFKKIMCGELKAYIGIS